MIAVRLEAMKIGVVAIPLLQHMAVLANIVTARGLFFGRARAGVGQG